METSCGEALTFTEWREAGKELGLKKHPKRKGIPEPWAKETDKERALG